MTVREWLEHKIDFGGKRMPRGTMIRLLQADGFTQTEIDRYLQGRASAERIRNKEE